MRRQHRHGRHAFSLLEMVLALALGMLLLLALYLSFDTYIQHARIGRDVVAEGTLARNIMARMAADVSGHLGAKDPRVNEYVDPVKTPDAPMNFVEFNFGVYGEESYVMLSGYRVRPGPADTTPDQPDAKISSDVKRIVYWIAMNGNEPAGLARAELPQATSPEADLDPSQLPDQLKYVIAPEVRGLKLRYYNGSGWVSRWDGLDKSLEDAPPNGPPGAIEITLTLKRDLRDGTGTSVDGPSFVNIVAIPAANNFPIPATP